MMLRLKLAKQICLEWKTHEENKQENASFPPKLFVDFVVHFKYRKKVAESNREKYFSIGFLPTLLQDSTFTSDWLDTRITNVSTHTSSDFIEWREVRFQANCIRGRKKLFSLSLQSVIESLWSLRAPPDFSFEPWSCSRFFSVTSFAIKTWRSASWGWGLRLYILSQQACEQSLPNFFLTYYRRLHDLYTIIAIIDF